MRVVEDVVGPDQRSSLLGMVEAPPPEAAAGLRSQCESIPYDAIDPTTGDVPRYLKYLLNQVRFRVGEIVCRFDRCGRVYPASTTLRLLAGPLAPSSPDPAPWPEIYRAIVPLDRRCVIHAPGRPEIDLPPGSVALVGSEVGSRWRVEPDTDSPWFALTVAITDQLECCEL